MEDLKAKAGLTKKCFIIMALFLRVCKSYICLNVKKKLQGSWETLHLINTVSCADTDKCPCAPSFLYVLSVCGGVPVCEAVPCLFRAESVCFVIWDSKVLCGCGYCTFVWYKQFLRKVDQRLNQLKTLRNCHRYSMNYQVLFHC